MKKKIIKNRKWINKQENEKNRKNVNKHIYKINKSVIGLQIKAELQKIHNGNYNLLSRVKDLWALPDL